jgi:hypothetical protein
MLQSWKKLYRETARKTMQKTMMEAETDEAFDIAVRRVDFFCDD